MYVHLQTYIFLVCVVYVYTYRLTFPLQSLIPSKTSFNQKSSTGAYSQEKEKDPKGRDHKPEYDTLFSSESLYHITLKLF